MAQHDDLHPDDVADQSAAFTDRDGREGTEHMDALDEVRYFLRTSREMKAPKPENAIERKLKAFRQQQQNEGFDYQYRR